MRVAVLFLRVPAANRSRLRDAAAGDSNVGRRTTDGMPHGYQVPRPIRLCRWAHKLAASSVPRRTVRPLRSVMRTHWKPQTL